MQNIEIIGKAVAAAISQSGKFGNDEHRAALALIAKESSPTDLVDNMAYVGNVSAIRQRLEKCGAVLPSVVSPDAFQRQVLASLEALKPAAKSPAK